MPSTKEVTVKKLSELPGRKSGRRNSLTKQAFFQEALKKAGSLKESEFVKIKLSEKTKRALNLRNPQNAALVALRRHLRNSTIEVQQRTEDGEKIIVLLLSIKTSS